ncbi:MAG: Predicted ATPase, AAA+ ATPase superfamily [Candidatus Kentron sp. G]|nr:MAG: Predicted ATPase, AAA+ ATPase superfamily [Candidatus Kentron sp. G]VFN00681.1 MAG: Predicted ATPase, AAA+ ATPase superfamily [Candidatus Kentron sp. G]VFN01541.1 MAG: Predicted ATPase, AAA+ ATPase superfamily [Candidatus Kentron sp. G]
MGETPFPVNPYRPAAGHEPPFLAGRDQEKQDFEKLLAQSVITDNLILSGLRGVGKTVLLNHMKPIAQGCGWLWAGEDLTEQASLKEERIVTRIMTDLASLLGPIFVTETPAAPMGFNTPRERNPLGYDDLDAVYRETPGLVGDKLKSVLRYVGGIIKDTEIKGIVFAYDEAQNLSDHSAKEEFPLSLLLDVFQSLQRQPDNLPFMLVLTGLPTLFPKLIAARTYSERMFHTIFLDRLSDNDSRDAVIKPLEKMGNAFGFTDETVELIVKYAGGYPYFIQFICKESFDILSAKLLTSEKPSVSMDLILRKLDQDFFSARWGKATDKQRVFLSVIARLPNCEKEFTAGEIIAKSEALLDKAYNRSNTSRFLKLLSDAGLLYKNSRGKYQFAVPMLSGFISRWIDSRG